MPTLAGHSNVQVDQPPIIDGEFVALNPQGQRLSLLKLVWPVGQARHSLLRFRSVVPDGVDLRSSHLCAQGSLQRCVTGAKASSCQIHAHSVGRRTFLARAKALGLEGIVSKRASSATRRARKDWQKCKVSCAEFVTSAIRSSGSRLIWGRSARGAKRKFAVLGARRHGVRRPRARRFEASAHSVGRRARAVGERTARRRGRDVHWVKRSSWPSGYTA